MNLFKSKIQIFRIFCFSVFLFLGVSVFQCNIIGSSDSYFFSTFDRYSQALVTGNIVADSAGLDRGGWNLGSISINGETEYSDYNWESYNRAVAAGNLKSIEFTHYPSQYGIQGAAFLWITNFFGVKNILGLNFVGALLFSITVTALSYLYTKVYDLKFGAVFFLVMIGSPWIVAMARNIYWVPFLWFLPAVFSAMLYLSKQWRHKAFFLFCVAFSIFLKSLAGYEYLSNIVIFTCAIFVTAPFFRDEKVDYSYNIKMAFLVGIACIFGFLCAFLIHAGMRGDSILQGISNIIDQDVKRRTYGSASNFGEVYSQSLNSSIITVFDMYWSGWKTDIIAWLPKSFLNYSVTFVFLGLCYFGIKKKTFDVKIAALILFYFAASVSWFFLAKAHSFIHTQLNYVLWYFGFIQALAYAVLCIALMLLADTYNLFRHGGRLERISAVAFFGLLVLLYSVKAAESDRELDRVLDAKLESSVDSFDIGSGFKVFFSQGHELIYLKKDCNSFDLGPRFFLHAYPESPEGKVDMASGFGNFDFEWASKSQPKRIFSKYRNSCVAFVDLPAFSLKKINTGQFTVSDMKIIWQGSADLSEKSYLRTLTPLDFTDINWNKGVSRSRAGFFVENSFINRQSLKVGGVVTFSGSGTKTIKSIEYSEPYINIYFEGHDLNPDLDGYPNRFNID
ncbi:MULTISPECIES: hypothetical protein [unclassified Pseudomonas]|uniref:hypothetical protein n=1 Tax=unclassified Pseudomonas TaxID=196821 RepID=UPI000AB2C1DA|nr:MULTISPECIES: hypothetical protein [unclassified Pseudomonas]QIH06799.1 hypothetical protein ATY02_08805 [Pseudomonas sp. BIOMIG1BAC]